MLTFHADFTERVSSDSAGSVFGASAGSGSGGGSLHYVIRLYYNAEGANDYVQIAPNDQSCGSASENFAGILKSVSNIRAEISPFDASYAVANVTFRVADGLVGIGSATETAAAFFNFSEHNYRNRAVKIYYRASGMDSEANWPLIFDGIVLDWHYDEQTHEYVFECVAKSEKLHKDLPATLVTKTAYTSAPESSIGMPLPLLYGTFDNDESSNVKDTHNGLWNIAPSVCTDASNGTFVFAEHACFYLFNSAVGLWDHELGAFAWAIRNDNNDYCTISITGPTTAILPINNNTKYLYCSMGLTIPLRLKGSGNTVTDVTNIIDGKCTTGTALANSASLFFRLNNSGSVLLFPLTPDAMSICIGVSAVSPGLNNSSLFVRNPMSGETYNAALPTGNFHTVGDKTGTFEAFDHRSDIEGVSITTNSQWTWDELANYEFGLIVHATETMTVNYAALQLWSLKISIRPQLHEPPPRIVPRPSQAPVRPGVPGVPGLYGLSGPSPTALQNAAIVADFKRSTIEGISSVFSEILGREFGSWIDIEGRSNSYSAGNIIEQGCFIIESILRDELAVPTADINTTGFDAGLVRVMAFSLNERIGSRELIRKLSYFSNGITFATSDNVWKHWAFPTTPAASDLDIDYSAIRINNVYMSSPDYLCNSARIHYQWDYPRGIYARDTTAESTASQGTTVVGENRTAQVDFECPYYRWKSSTATSDAISFANAYLAQWKNPHLCMDFDLLDVSQWKLQEGDVVSFNNMTIDPLGLAEHDDPLDTFASFWPPRLNYWLITKCDRSLERCSYTAFQLHDLS